MKSTDEQGKEFQDHIAEIYSIPFYTSRRYQLEKGESPNPLGIECKWNREADKMGCWIELLEKRDPTNGKWIVGDWVNNKNVHFIMAGNMSRHFLFAKKTLFGLASKREIKMIAGGTSVGYYLSRNDCERFSLIEPTEENEILSLVDFYLNEQDIPF